MQYGTFKMQNMLALVLIILLAACGAPDSSKTQLPTADIPTDVPGSSSSTAPGSMLTDGSWTLTSFGPSDQAASPITGTITLTFAPDGSISGSSGCNSMFGSYVITDTLLTLSNMGQTMMACQPELMEQEARYSAALNAVTEFAQTGTTLTLSYPDGTLVFEQVPAASAPSLDGTMWQFDGFAAGDTVTIMSGAEMITLELRDGTVSGNSGCNTYSASAIIQDQQLTIDPIASTKMACPDMDAEQQFLTALQAVTGWEIQGQTLSLSYPDGTLRFVAQQ